MGALTLLCTGCRATVDVAMQDLAIRRSSVPRLLFACPSCASPRSSPVDAVTVALLAGAGVPDVVEGGGPAAPFGPQDLIRMQAWLWSSAFELDRATLVAST